MTRLVRPAVVCSVLLLLTVVALHVHAADLPGSEKQKIEALIHHLEHLSDAVFIRNNKTYHATTAAMYLRRKWEATLDSNSNFGSQDVSSLGLSLRASLASSLSPLIMKSIR
jgi:hypothetical protein